MHGLVEGELVACATHAHPLCCEVNAEVYCALEEATCSTQHAALLKPFQRGKDSRAALFAIKNENAGEDKWETERKRQEDVMHNRMWKGQSNFTLERFIGQHRNAYVMLQQCAEHIAYQLPNERTRVTCLLDNTQCADVTLQAAIAAVRQDKGPHGMMNDFESAVAYLLPSDPVAKKCSAGQKQGQGLTSDAEGEAKEEAEVSAAASTKVARGKTGMEFCFYKKSEHATLMKAQKDKLRECCKVHGMSVTSARDRKQDGAGSKMGKAGHQKAIAATVKEQLTVVQQRQEEEEKTHSNFKDYILSIVKGSTGVCQKLSINSTQATTEIEVPKSTLNSILKKVKFAS